MIFRIIDDLVAYWMISVGICGILIIVLGVLIVILYVRPKTPVRCPVCGDTWITPFCYNGKTLSTCQMCDVIFDRTTLQVVFSKKDWTK